MSQYTINVAAESGPSFPTKAMFRYRKIAFNRAVCGLFLTLNGLFNVPMALSQTSDGTSCIPVIVAIEGGAGSGGESIRKLAKQLVPNVHGYVISVENDYFFDGLRWIFPVFGSRWIFPVFDDDDADNFAETLKNLGLWPIVLIGHSLGGSSAHSIASRIDISLLLTLDAVSTPDDKSHPGGGAKWINVYAKNFFFLGNSSGEDWEHEPKADVNNSLKNTGHYEVIKMFNSAAEAVYNALNRCTKNPHDQHRLDKRIYKSLCGTTGVYCFEGEGRLRG